MIKREHLISFFLRLAISSVFLYAAISGILQPEAWIGFIPQFIQAIIPGEQFLIGYSIYQILLSLWLLSGYRIFYAAILSCLTLAAILVMNLGALDIVFRDIAILFSGVALAVMSHGSKK